MKQDLLATLRERLGEGDGAALQTLVRLARRRRERVYLVGGSVRDLLLGREHVDLDVAVEGDAIGLAEELAKERKGRVVAHPAFGTASVEMASGRLDLARTRAETYERPGALPTVREASIEEDLRRRDFTVNAMALRLTPPRAGELHDPLDGRRNLEQRLIRVLHEASFQDDATRMLRAVRYEARLGFRLETETERLLRRDLSYVDAISGARLRAEIVAMFFEERAREMLARCEELGIFESIHVCLRFDDAGAKALERAREERPAPWDEFCMCLLCGHCEEEDVESVVRRLALSKRFERALTDFVRVRGQMAPLVEPGMSPSRVTEVLEPFAPSAVWALALSDDNEVAAERARLFLCEWRYVKSFLGASALRRLGVPAGPELGHALHRLRAARLDGATQSREDELALLGYKQEE
jgi:tRNA nucleotidyltransferase (CCA-adding enzyme)